MLILAVVQVQATSGEPLSASESFSPSRWIAWIGLAPHAQMNPYLPTAYTLPNELTFYAIFGLLLLTAPRWAMAGLLLWAIASVVVELIGVSRSPMGHTLFNLHVLEIVLGCAIAGMVRRGWLFGGRAVLFAGVLWAAVLVVARNPHTVPYYLTFDPCGRIATFGLAAGMIVYGLAAVELQRGWATPRFLSYLGDASYSIYLGHIPAGSALFGLTLTIWPHTLLGPQLVGCRHDQCHPRIRDSLSPIGRTAYPAIRQAVAQGS